MWTSSTVKNEHESLLAVGLRRSLPTRMIWFCDTIRRNELPLLSQADSHDFGLAGLADEFRDDEIAAGTPAYMAPEQLEGKNVTIRMHFCKKVSDLVH